MILIHSLLLSLGPPTSLSTAYCIISGHPSNVDTINKLNIDLNTLS